MIRLNLVLLISVVWSALYLVQMQYESRRLFIELDKARKESDLLNMERSRLESRRSTESTHLRVAQVASEKLQMQTANPGNTVYVPGPKSGTQSAPGGSR